SLLCPSILSFLPYTTLFRSRHLAAVVQPGREPEGLALVFAQMEAGIGTVGLGLHAVGQQDGQFRHTLAVSAGVGTLGVDGVAQEDRKSTRLNSSHLKISYAV